MLVLFEYSTFIQEEFLDTYFEEEESKEADPTKVVCQYNTSGEFEHIFKITENAFRRTFN